MINNKIYILAVYPITKELSIQPRAKAFSLKWLDFIETQIEVQTKNDYLYEAISKHLENYSMYQREAFGSSSRTHQWIWYYQDSMHPRLKETPAKEISLFAARETVQFKPEHYGTNLMTTYIKEQLKKREDEFSCLKEIKVFVGTWNCAGTPPDPDQSIRDWLKGENVGRYDLIVICLQEMCPLTASNIMGDEIREAEWVTYITRQVNLTFNSQNFSKVNSK